MSWRNKQTWLKHLDFMVLDLIGVEGAIWLAYQIRGKETSFEGGYGKLAMAIAILFLCITFFREPYSGIVRRGYLIEGKKVLGNTTILMACLLAFLFVFHISNDYSRIVLFLFYVLSIGMTFLLRVIWKEVLRKYIKEGKNHRELLVVTKEEYIEQCRKKLFSNPFSFYQIKGILLLEEAKGKEKIEGLEVVGEKKDLIRYCQKEVVDDVLFYLKEEKIEELANKLVEMGIIVHVNIPQLEDNERNYQIESINGILTVTSSLKDVSIWQVAVKRGMDICGGIIGCILTGIIFVIVAPIIKIQSPGPIFFVQKRVGKNGRIFRMYKFRSMEVDAEKRKEELRKANKMQGNMFKVENDPRIYPFGKILRRTSLDEFPQFLNVLKGDMSLCGTRPPTIEEYEKYEPHHKSRLAMKPGMTGLWQVSGRNNITDFEEVVRLDKEYIKNVSLSLDIKILVRTVAVVLGREGSI